MPISDVCVSNPPKEQVENLPLHAQLRLHLNHLRYLLQLRADARVGKRGLQRRSARESGGEKTRIRDAVTENSVGGLDQRHPAVQRKQILLREVRIACDRRAAAESCEIQVPPGSDVHLLCVYAGAPP